MSDGFNDTFQIISPQLRKMRAHFTAGCRKNGDGAELGRDGVVIPTAQSSPLCAVLTSDVQSVLH